ncbi:MAG: DoxX family protein [Gammaproteobacteria bacterium]|nr:DoxX family protein [Gammaproteobacteria bacterium]
MNTVFALYTRFEKIVQAMSPAVDLAIRLYIAWIFFKSGLLKIQSWESTLTLFEYEYAVPLLSTEMAAYLGTAAELVLPALLALGLAGRFAALALFLFNIVAVMSYPDLSDVGRQHHFYWGMLLAMLAVHGPGLLSADGWLARRCQACPS